MRRNRLWSAAVLGLSMLGFASVTAVAATPRAAIDLGPAANTADGNQVTFTVALKLRDAAEAQQLLMSLYTPGSPLYHHFLTTRQFDAAFAPTPDAVARVVQHFQAAGMQVQQTTGSILTVTADAATVGAEFGVQMHLFEVGASGNHPGYRYRAPVGTPIVAATIANEVQGVIGLDNRPRFHPHVMHSAAKTALAGVSRIATANSTGTSNAPGLLTVADFAQYYDVDPLYKKGLSGRGTTIGIVTLASFTPSDAYAYWNSLGLKVSNHRIHEIQVDGGAGAPSDAAGSIETTLDVEQSGGVAPGATIRVYEAPNTSQGFVDAFATAIDANVADTISVSWGEWEFFDTLAVGGPVSDAVTGRNVSVLQAYNDLFLQAALQGQSMYTAAGDSGAYDSAPFFPPTAYPVPPGGVVLSVDDPSAQPWITAVGGTTLAGTQTYALPGGSTLAINLAQEQAWGWDYLVPLCSALGLDPVACGIYPVGGGGGVSSYVARPPYQYGVDGMKRTAGGQTLFDYSQTPAAFVVTLPEGFAGRNVPDISLNADPETGYIIDYTSSASGFGVAAYYGGTSFAAPQFNGVTALFDQAVHGRVGLMNFALYGLARHEGAYEGQHAPLRDISAGDNWFYSAHEGYDQATGLGVPDFANLLTALTNGERD